MTPTPTPTPGLASLGPRCLIGKIYVEDHQTTLLQTKYVSCEPHDFRAEEFFIFSPSKSMGDNEPWGVASLDPRGLVGRIHVGDH